MINNLYLKLCLSQMIQSLHSFCFQLSVEYSFAPQAAKISQNVKNLMKLDDYTELHCLTHHFGSPYLVTKIGRRGDPK